MFLTIVIIFLTAFGDWVEANIGSIITFLLAAVGVAAWLIRLEEKVKNNGSRMDDFDRDMTECSSEVTSHVADSSKHVNHLYMSEMAKRIDRIETAVSNGHEKILGKIELLSEKIHGR